MKSKIRILDDHTINQIKAGEVIENASSVVKELIENAIDAEASKISIEIRGGGRNLIKITDNGIGMSFDDAILAFERHATSKISSHDDLFSLATMGFRGEAIPSISSISKFTLFTRPKEEPRGTFVSVHGGKMLEASPFECAEGTSIEIKSLFFNVPVRKKFQKSLAFETLEVQKVVQKMALSHPLIDFELIADDKKLLSLTHTPLKDSLSSFKERILQLFPEYTEKNLIPLEFSLQDFYFLGFLLEPSLHKSNRTSQYLFINKRAVVSSFISYAVKTNYGTLIPENRFPPFFLHMELPPKLLDVNVHPQKKEIRLRQELIIKDALGASIQKALLKTVQKPETSLPNSFLTENSSTEMPQKSSSYQYVFKEDPFQKNFPTSPYSSFSSFSEEIEPLQEEPLYQDMLPLKENFEDVFALSWKKEGFIGTIKGFILIASDASFPKNFPFPKKEGVLFFNHKLCYERILFEKIVKKNTSFEKETLLFPFTFQVTLEEEGYLMPHLGYFKEKGLELVLSSPLQFSLYTLPCYLRKSSFEYIKEAILDYVSLDIEDKKDPYKEESKWAASMAEKLSPSKESLLHKEEALSLLESLFQCDLPFYSPKGKPTFYALESVDLLKHFQKGTKELCI